MIKWTLKEDGTIVPGGGGGIDPLALPGKVGDETVRAEIFGQNLIVYANNGVVFSAAPAPFVKIQQSDGTWATPISQGAVTGYDKWGKVEIPLAQLPENGLLAFRYGPNRIQSTIYNDSQKNSMFWDSYFRVLKIVCRQVKSANLLGETQDSWIIANGAIKQETS